MEPFLSTSTENESYTQIAEDFDMTESAVKMAVSRMRKRYGGAIREEIAGTVEDPEQVEDELKALFEALRQG